MSQIEPPTLKCKVCEEQFKAPKLQHDAEYCHDCWNLILDYSDGDVVICKYE